MCKQNLGSSNFKITPSKGAHNNPVLRNKYKKGKLEVAVKLAVNFDIYTF